MKKLLTVMEEVLNENLQKITISNIRSKMSETKKITIHPCLVGKELVFQLTIYKGTQVFHENLEKEVLMERIEQELSKNFKQLEVVTSRETIAALVSKKGVAVIKRRKKEYEQSGNLTHNREKNYLLKKDIAVPFLIDLGVQTKEGKIIDKKYHKFKQINRFLELVQDILPALPKDREVTIIDFGCGKSYLTFAMYYYLKKLNGYSVKMIGLDLKKDVIEHCNQLRTKYGYEQLDFYEGDISTYKGVKQVDMVVTLHACDTATDYALAKAIGWEAKVILSVPCCQHELNGQIQNELLQPILKYGVLKERMAALITDGLRANLLEQHGYKTQILEFVDMSHTPKNLMIRAVKSSGIKGDRKGYEELTRALQCNSTLEKELFDKEFNIKTKRLDGHMTV